MSFWDIVKLWLLIAFICWLLLASMLRKQDEKPLALLLAILCLFTGPFSLLLYAFATKSLVQFLMPVIELLAWLTYLVIDLWNWILRKLGIKL